MQTKTVSSLRVKASWTPDPATAERMLAAAFEGHPQAGALRFDKGSLTLRVDITNEDASDVDNVVAAAKHIAAIKESLGATGSIATFVAPAGAAKRELAITVADLDEAEGGKADE